MRTLSAPARNLTADDDAVRTHLAGLRLDPRSANPPGWRVDWEDGPWPVTVRAGGARLPLRGGSGDPLMDRVDRLLRGTFALGRVRFDPRGGLPATPEDPLPRHRGPRVTARRPIPSGGSMYPTEAYLLLAGPDRLCHHDPYRHELLDLGHPAPSAAVWAAVGDGPPAPALLVLTHRFWKNFYKYGEFAYRLGAVDVGVALGRALRLGAAAFGRARLYPDLDDDALAACLGVDPADEG
ncbi:MAG TPA: SagB/ThcOx family dehydrogenase, partial [Pseudonocardiaceae bacterium]